VRPFHERISFGSPLLRPPLLRYIRPWIGAFLFDETLFYFALGVDVMSIIRLSITLGILGLVSIAAGVSFWAARMPETWWLRSGYAQCLWRYKYQVTSNVMPDRYKLTSTGKVVWLMNPNWDPNNAACDNVEADRSNDIVGENKRRLQIIMTGVDPGAPVRESPPILFTPPALNGIGVFLVLIGVVFFFARRHDRSPA
jgi:hypothetical protein